ncbi:MAG: deoxyguanosinetriphosphate triphosphohydrolase, partial [Actinomycetota bacterium]|nr:deoxyguanosinetriphosphate triphosphohydrolase [Actinomycetota bacterium]
IRMSDDVFAAMGVTREFLFEHVYLGQVAPATRAAVKRIVQTLLEYYSANPIPETSQLPPDDAVVRAVDYVAGMTDRFALRTFEGIVGGPAPGFGLALG